MGKPSKDDIKRGRPQKCLNVEVGRVVPMAKTTLNVPPADHTNVARPTAKTTFETTDHTNDTRPRARPEPRARPTSDNKDDIRK